MIQTTMTPKSIILAFGILLQAALVCAQGVIFSLPREQVFTEAGLVVDGAKLCSYAAGTTTPLSTYSDSALSIANTNPVVASSAGRFGAIYLLKQSYKFALLTAGSDATCTTGTTIWTADQVPGGYDASVIVSGVLGTARLGSGSATANTVLRGDGTWAGLWTVITSTATGTQNDFAPGLVNNTIVRMNNGSTTTITGLAGGVDGQHVKIVAVGTAQVDLTHQSTSSTTAADRFVNYVTSGATSIAPPTAAGGEGGFVEYVYDATTARWRLTAHEQGDWLTRTYASGNFTTNGAGGWTVASGDVSTDAYWLKGSTLTLVELLAATTVTAATGTELRVTLPAGFVGARRLEGPVAATNNGVTSAGTWDVQVDVAYIRFYIDAIQLTAWTASADNTTIRFTGSFEVK